ncbi:MAG TPA: chemotaxis protein CheW [Gammaproteobacteria bacterium]|nr:chemotaxis protein CheW [Gammaproteobacteria bacterium]
MSTPTTSGSRKNLSSLRSKDTLHCLLLPLQDSRMLLPNTAVAEVIGYSLPQPQDGAPDWFLGYIDWRDIRVPLLSFEIFTGEGGQVAGAKRIAVLNTLNGNPRLPYLAIPLQGIPQLRLVTEAALADARTDADTEGIAARIELGDERVLVPDLDWLEQRLLPEL